MIDSFVGRAFAFSPAAVCHAKKLSRIVLFLPFRFVAALRSLSIFIGVPHFAMFDEVKINASILRPIHLTAIAPMHAAYNQNNVFICSACTGRVPTTNQMKVIDKLSTNVHPASLTWMSSRCWTPTRWARRTRPGRKSALTLLERNDQNTENYETFVWQFLCSRENIKAHYATIACFI